MSVPNSLSNARYLEILERVVFGGHYPLDADKDHKRRIIQILGGRINERVEAEMWEADQFIERVGDLKHELGPASLTDHLMTLDVHARGLELKRFYARTV